MEAINTDNHGKKRGSRGREGGRGRGHYASKGNQGEQGEIMSKKLLVAKETHPKKK